MQSLRRDFQIIAGLVPENAKVLDLGCGDGSLMAYLRREKKADVRGIEIQIESVAETLAHGLAVYQGDVDEGLALFPDRFFDVVILSRTIQEVEKPHLVLQEMLRVGRRGIVGFLNYGFYRNRLSFLLTGRKPKSEALPQDWYNTPNIHPISVCEFETYCREAGIRIAHRTFLKGDWERATTLFPNLLAGYAIYMIEK